MKPKYHPFYLRVAEEAAQLSYCVRRKVGCVIVCGDHMWFGYNGTAPGAENVCETPDNVTRPDVIHAEENALRKFHEAVDMGLDVRHRDIFVFLTDSPCLPCAEEIEKIRPTLVLYRNAYRKMDGVEYLAEKGIEVRGICE